MFRRKFSTILFLGALLFGFSAAGTQVTASAKTTLKTFPKSLQRTWYHYDHGNYSVVKFTPKTWKTSSVFDGHHYHSSAPLHYKYINTDTSTLHKHSNWVFANIWTVGHSKWTNIMGWNQGAGDGTSYKLETKTHKHKRFRVMSEGGGAGFWISSHYYTSKKVAKAFGNHHFSGERYYPTY